MNSDLSMIRQIGYNALISELGVCGTVIFMRQFERGYGNYTEERESILKDLTIDDIVYNILIKKITE